MSGDDGGKGGSADDGGDPAKSFRGPVAEEWMNWRWQSLVGDRCEV